MRPCPRAVVAGSGRGRGRLPPSTLYMRVLALKSHPCLSRVANADVAEVGADQRVEQIGSFPLQEVGCDDVVVRAVEDQRGDVDLAVHDRRLTNGPLSVHELVARPPRPKTLL